MRVIDFYEAQGEQMAHYAKVLQDKGYVYGKHILPHDAGAHAMKDGKSTQQVAWEEGLKAIVLKSEKIGPGIEAARQMLGVCFIDGEKCRHLIKCLEHYHKKYNEKMNCYSDTAVHDWSSHAADAFRYCAVARRDGFDGGGGGEGPAPTPSNIKQWDMKHRGYGGMSIQDEVKRFGVAWD